MNIKKFTAKTVQEAVQMVKREMGQEAVILRTRTLGSTEGGPLKKGGINGTKAVEVTAAVDYEALGPTGRDLSQRDYGELSLKWGQVESELRQLKEALLSAGAEKILPPEMLYNRSLSSRYVNYKTFGLRPDIIRNLMEEWQQNKGNEKMPDSKILQDSLINVLRRINIRGNQKKAGGREICAFIGPTGVGKTTTLAKIAAMKALKQGKKAALITLDTFRIAAAAQLQTYARIMGIPFEVAVGSSDLQKAISKHEHCDCILIDTAGRSPNRDKDINELKGLFDLTEKVHHYLVLSATARYRNLLNADQKFGTLPIKSYIFTKIDETQDVSDMVNFLISKERPVSYFTTGQQVPDDIEIASKKKLASLLLSKMRSSAENTISGVN